MERIIDRARSIYERDKNFIRIPQKILFKKYMYVLNKYLNIAKTAVYDEINRISIIIKIILELKEETCSNYTTEQIKEYFGDCADIEELIELNLKIKTRNKKVVFINPNNNSNKIVEFINPNNNSNKKVFSKKKTILIDINERINE